MSSFVLFQIQDQGVDPNLRDGDGATPLHFAASRGHLDTVRWLLKHGARLSLDKFGKSPINDAAENQQVEVSKNASDRLIIILFDSLFRKNTEVRLTSPNQSV